MSAARFRSERGAALLTVLVSVAVLTALAVDLAYESRVSLRIAANARDELRAGYQARSGVAFSRLVLSFQQQLDGRSGGVNFPGKAPGKGMPRLLLWKAVPVSSDALAGLFGGGSSGSTFQGSLFDGRPKGQDARPAGPPASEPATGDAAASARDGAAPESRPRTGGGLGFDAVIEDEATKLNAQIEKDGSVLGDGVGPQVLSIYHLMCEARWDPLFDREDANGVKTTREELFSRLREWVDEGKSTYALQAAYGTASCSMTLPRLPIFQASFGDKNAPYDRGDDRYQTKSAHMDSLDELYLVAGVSDAFMAAFGDQLTVYPARDAKRTLDDTSLAGVRTNALQFAEQLPQNLILLFDPAVVGRIQKALLELSPLGLFSVSSQDYAQAMTAAGVAVDSKAVTNWPQSGGIATFRVRSTGTAGDVKRTVEAVVRLDPQGQVQAQPQQPGVAAPGRVIHWREE